MRRQTDRDIMALTMQDSVILVPLALVIVVLTQQKTKTFLLVDASLALVETVALIFATSPFTYGSLSSVPYDDLHHLLNQFNLCYGLMTPLYYLFFARSSKSEEATSALLTARTVELGLMVFNQCRNPQIFNNRVTFHLYQSGAALPKSGPKSFINKCLKIDICIESTFGIIDIVSAAFVGYLTSARVDILHEHILTVASAGHLTSALMGIYALSFSNMADKKGYIYCRLTLLLILGGCFFYSVMQEKIILTVLDWVLYLVGLVQIAPLLVGLLNSGVEVPSKQE